MEAKRWKNSDEPTTGQIKTGPSVSEPHHQVQAEPEPQCQAIASLHEPTQNQASATIYQTQQSTRANETLPQQQLQQQHYQPQPNQRTYGLVQPAAPPMPAQFSPQTAQNTGPNEHPLEYPPLSRQQTIPIQPNQDVGVIYQQQQGVPQAIYQQPPPSYPQNYIAPPFAASSYVSHSQTVHDVTYEVPPQYVAASGFPVPVDGWKTGLFDCMDDPMNALITVCFPCVTFGQVAEIVDEGHTSCGTSGLLYGLIAFFIGVPCILSCAYRTKLRNKLGLVESPAPDWVTHCFCDWCALCQEYRELQQRGWDPSIGWHGNLAKRQSIQQQQHLAMMPPINQTMFA
ncbi:PREDICTED: protein PLANT CADMIUM RESISTANCE 4 [Theobroma cacao]|uniref:Protein PLANT CADMIUM RESISTANCE 4 n=1 Tax=Theobroma cacao TaxID=3641 RepID=A0AB32W068_THECC|nr:PREDICTED: protein PLANT CADMIUM RESISTANCE 4 [Theobroma cacao]